MSRIAEGDYVEVIVTGRAGEVMERKGKKLTVLHHPVCGEYEAVLYAEKELRKLEIPPLTRTGETVAVIRASRYLFRPEKEKQKRN